MSKLFSLLILIMSLFFFQSCNSAGGGGTSTAGTSGTNSETSIPEVDASCGGSQCVQ